MKKNNSNKVKLGASDKIVRGFGYVVISCVCIPVPFDPWQLVYGRRSDPCRRCTADSETVYTGGL